MTAVQQAAVWNGRAQDLPDPLALGVSEYRRKVKLLARYGDGAGPFSKLLVAANHRLLYAVINLRKGNLYSQASKRYAQQVADRIVGKCAAYITLEKGKRGILHINILAAQHDRHRLKLPKGACVQDVWPGTEETLFLYLCKAHDAKANTSRDWKTRRHERPSQKDILTATRDLSRAREVSKRQGRTRLPRLAWSRNIPRLKPHDEQQWTIHTMT